MSLNLPEEVQRINTEIVKLQKLKYDLINHQDAETNPFIPLFRDNSLEKDGFTQLIIDLEHYKDIYLAYHYLFKHDLIDKKFSNKFTIDNQSIPYHIITGKSSQVWIDMVLFIFLLISLFFIYLFFVFFYIDATTTRKVISYRFYQ
jgi:hypothetical protein